MEFHNKTPMQWLKTSKVNERESELIFTLEDFAVWENYFKKIPQFDYVIAATAVCNVCIIYLWECITIVS